MPAQTRRKTHRFHVGAAIALALVLAGACVGYWLGKYSVPVQDIPGIPKSAAKEPAPPEHNDPGPPPLYFLMSVPAGDASTAVAGEIAMAAEAGIHQYVLTVSLPWQGDMNAFTGALNLLTKTDPQARVMFNVRLDPPDTWLGAHPGDVAIIGDKTAGVVCIASRTWQEEAGAALDALISAISTALTPERVAGYLLGALEGGLWRRETNGYDVSSANIEGFRRWLHARYKDDGALREAWADPNVILDSAAIPDEPPSGPGGFLNLPEQRRVVDFLTYTSDATADAIRSFTTIAKQRLGETTPVLATYGYSYEFTSNTTGHFALAKLMDTPLDGFASPISHVDRGLGGIGGPMAPVDSALFHGKQWFLIDDTRTGIARDSSTGELAPPKNVRMEDIYSVQQRNFAAALTHGLGLFWSDPAGDGWLHDKDMWTHFADFSRIYREMNLWRMTDGAETPRYPNAPTLAVVVDETSRFYQRNEEPLNQLLLNQVRDAALRLAVPVQFYLLRDVLNEMVPPVPAYLFLNTFVLTADERRQLHGLLARSRAAAIWLYAPGYIDGQNASVDNISATTRMTVRAFKGPAKSGSVCLLPGRWIKENEAFGAPIELDPLFYVDDPNTDNIAQFAASQKPSVSIRFLEEGWSSIFCAEPEPNAPILRELLGILELHVYYQDLPAKFYDAVHIGPNLMAVHAKETGERPVELDVNCNIQDLFETQTGWLSRRTFKLPMKAGATRLLKLIPSETETEPIIAPEPQTPASQEANTQMITDEVSTPVENPVETAQPESGE